MPGHVWKISTEVITWGSPMYGGSSSRVEHQLQGGALMLDSWTPGLVYFYVLGRVQTIDLAA